MLQQNETELINLMMDHGMSKALSIRAAQGLRSTARDKMIQYLKETDSTDPKEIKKLLNKAAGYPEETKWLDGDGNEIE